MGFSAQPVSHPCILERGGQGGNAPGELWAEVLSFGDKVGIWDLRRKPVHLAALWQSTKEHMSMRGGVPSKPSDLSSVSCCIVSP